MTRYDLHIGYVALLCMVLPATVPADDVALIVGIGAVRVAAGDEQADPPALTEYMTRFTEFLDHGKKKGFVRKELDTQMVTGAMLDRISNQVQFAPWVKRNYGTDLSDPAYKKRWCASNLDLFLHGMLP